MNSATSHANMDLIMETEMDFSQPNLSMPIINLDDTTYQQSPEQIQEAQTNPSNSQNTATTSSAVPMPNPFDVWYKEQLQSPFLHPAIKKWIIDKSQVEGQQFTDMKPLVLSILFCCWGYTVAFPEIPEVQTTDTTTPELVNEPTIDTNSSDNWAPPQSFLSGAFSAFTVIAVSELGDKTFFIAVVLALTCSPLCVFLGALSALAIMTMLSAGLGLVSTVIPNFWVQTVAAALFIIFGIKMFREAYMMKSTAGKDELEDVQKSLDSKMAIVDTETGGTRRRAVRWVFIEAFAMTFLAEWGDRSQITTLLLAAKENIYGVFLGATLGHAACTLLAVLGGRFVSDKISLRVVTYIGAVLFFVFAILSIVNAVQEYMNPTTS